MFDEKALSPIKTSQPRGLLASQLLGEMFFFFFFFLLRLLVGWISNSSQLQSSTPYRSLMTNADWPSCVQLGMFGTACRSISNMLCRISTGCLSSTSSYWLYDSLITCHQTSVNCKTIKKNLATGNLLLQLCFLLTHSVICCFLERLMLIMAPRTLKGFSD